MKTILKRVYLVIFVLCFSIMFVSSARADSDEYDLELDENTEITWEFTTVNEALLEELFKRYDVDYEALNHDIEEGDEIKYKLTSYDEEDDYYMLYFNVYEDDELEGYTTHKIAKDPDDLSADWYTLPGEPVSNYGNSYDLLIILTDTRDYLEDFDNSIPAADHDRVYSTSSSIVINNTVLYRDDIGIFEYDEDGILEKFTLIYKDVPILIIELDDVSKSQLSILVFLIIGIIIAGVVVLLAVGIILIVKNKNKIPVKITPLDPKKGVIAPPISETPRTIPTTNQAASGSQKIRYCDLCGAKRDVDALFCTSCGNRF